MIELTEGKVNMTHIFREILIYDVKKGTEEFVAAEAHGRQSPIMTEEEQGVQVRQGKCNFPRPPLSDLPLPARHHVLKASHLSKIFLLIHITEIKCSKRAMYDIQIQVIIQGKETHFQSEYQILS